ncbi:hypothetical protein EVAR_33078_1 [Eumeta japonica]|uniref:Regulatory protein zeste n=1 Tax=Eumeta variegata TaxID=151549 RepID=A0A4C2A403_EUMVA|nr:hypothetical protein EVAR_33078_1 [Eumeta japonica]
MIGAKKTWKLWRKTWQDLQSKSKSKVTQAMEATGGGPPCEELSQSERMVIETMHPDNILGHSVLESIVTFEEQVISEPVVPVVVVTDDPVPVIISDITQDQSREKLGTQRFLKKEKEKQKEKFIYLLDST